jgi:hypothetical protein
MWYKQAGDLPLPTTKQLLRNKYHDTMMRATLQYQLQLL